MMKRNQVSNRFESAACAAVAAMALGLAAAPAVTADPIYETNGPFGGFFGVYGPDVSNSQSVGVRFTPSADYTLDLINMWFMNNDEFSNEDGFVTLTLRNDAQSLSGASIPGETIYEEWTFQITALGWDPQVEGVISQVRPLLEAGVNYWIVAESEAPPRKNPVWCFAANDSGYMAVTTPGRGEWQDGGTGAVVTVLVEGDPQIRDFTLSVPGGLVAGEAATFEVSNGLPLKMTYLAYSLTGAGSQQIPQLGIVLDIDRPKQAGEPFQTDEKGNGSVSVNVPFIAQGRTIHLQAAQRLAESDVVIETVQ